MLRTDASNDAEHDGHSRRNVIKSICQVVGGPDWLSIELDDLIAGPEPCLCSRRAGDHLAEHRPFIGSDICRFNVSETWFRMSRLLCQDPPWLLSARAIALISRRLRGW